MAKYDDSSWHYEGDFPKDLVNENASTHIGMFITWCINNDLISEEQIEDNLEDIIKVKERLLTGREFLISNCDEKFTDDDLSEAGNEFVADYYEDESEFSKKYSNYMTDYEEVFDEIAQKNHINYKTLYYIENSWENYEIIKLIIDKRFLEWKSFKNEK